MRLTRIDLIRRRLNVAGGIERNDMTNSSTAQVPTDSGSRYLQQLCKHWAHSMTVDFTPERGTIVFPRDGRGGPFAGDGLVTMIAHPATLECRIDASEPRHLEGLKGALARHLDRFAFREAPLPFDWTDG